MSVKPSQEVGLWSVPPPLFFRMWPPTRPNQLRMFCEHPVFTIAELKPNRPSSTPEHWNAVNVFQLQIVILTLPVSNFTRACVREMHMLRLKNPKPSHPTGINLAKYYERGIPRRSAYSRELSGSELTTLGG